MPNQHTGKWDETICACCPQPRVSGTLFCAEHLARVVEALKQPRRRGIFTDQRQRWATHNRKRRADGRL